MSQTVFQMDSITTLRKRENEIAQATYEHRKMNCMQALGIKYSCLQPTLTWFREQVIFYIHTDTHMHTYQHAKNMETHFKRCYLSIAFRS